MKTDTLFSQLFNTFHTLLFELIERPTSEAQGYEFETINFLVFNWQIKRKTNGFSLNLHKKFYSLMNLAQ